MRLQRFWNSIKQEKGESGSLNAILHPSGIYTVGLLRCADADIKCMCYKGRF